MAPVQDHNSHRRVKRIACVECRQQKARCDAHERAPEPCSRCIKKGIQCVLDTDYKRQFKRVQMARMEEDYKSLKRRYDEDYVRHKFARVGAGSMSPSESLAVQSHREGSPQGTAAFSPAASSSSSVPPTRVLADISPAVFTKSFGEVTLTPEQITELFQNFVQHYHLILPIVTVSHGIERIYRLCPILFWTIMFTSLRGFESEHISKEEALHLYFALSPILKSALAELSISPIARYAPTEFDDPVLNVSSVYSVQAFLLYTFWPPLTSSVSADSSWYSIGIAICQAIRIGLHLQGYSADGMKTQNPVLLEEQARTWAACNALAQSIATAFGFPSLSTQHALVPTGKLSPVFEEMLQIQLFERQVADTLNGYGNGQQLPMLKLLENELEQLEKKEAIEGLDSFRKLCLMSSRLHLLTYHFLDMPASSFDLSSGLMKAYDAACRYIRQCATCQAQNPDFARHIPTIYVLTVWQAACIVARLVHSSYSSLLDVMEGKNVYQAAISFARQASIIRHDMAYRASGIMQSTWALFKSLHEQNQLSLKVTITSRMSASVFFDSLWIVRQKSGMIRLAPKSLPDEDNGNNVKGPNPEPESDARKIINTIPLDPQPISLSGGENSRSPSSHSSPFVYKSSPTDTKWVQKTTDTSSAGPKKQPENDKSGASSNLRFLLDEKSPVFPSDWENEVDCEILFKDIDSVMNNFGFHTNS